MANKKKVFDQFRDCLTKAESLLSNNVNAPMAVIECDIVLEQLRSLYVAVSDYRNGGGGKKENIESSLFAPPEPVAVPEPIMSPAIDAIEGNPYDDLFAASGNIVAGTERLAQNIQKANSRMEAEEKARKEAEEAIRKAAEENARKEAEEAIRKAAEEKARKEAEEAIRKAAEEKARKEAEEAIRKAAEEKARKEAEEAIRKAAEEKARKEAEEAIRSTRSNNTTATGSLKDLLAQSSGGGKTLGEQLGNHSGLGDGQNDARVGQNKVSDLRNVISINDKFSFLTEMFHNNLKVYNDFILKLNTIIDREEALLFVEGVAQEYNWDKDSIVVKTFYSIFERKF